MTETYIDLPENVSMVPTLLNVSEASTSKSGLWYWRVLVFGLGGSVVCSLGVVCNFTAVLVLAKFKTASSAPFLLICLACLDATYLLFMMTIENVTVLSKAGVISRRYFNFILPLYKYFYAIPFVVQTCISYTVLLISVERFIVVAWPFKAYVICSKKIAAFAMTSILIFGVVFHVPNYLAFDNSYTRRNGTRTNPTFGRTRFGQSYFYIEVFSKWISMSINFLIPFLLLVAVNVKLLRALRSSKSPPGVQNRVHSEYRLTIMVFCMTAIFFLFELMEASSFILTAGIASYNQSSKVVQSYTACADLLTEINSALNFLIYCSTGRKFRDMFCRVFLPCLNRQRVKATAALTMKNIRQPAANHKPWTSWEFLSANIRCYQIRPSEGSISSSSTKSSKTSSLTRYNSQPNLKNVVL